MATSTPCNASVISTGSVDAHNNIEIVFGRKLFNEAAHFAVADNARVFDFVPLGEHRRIKSREKFLM